MNCDFPPDFSKDFDSSLIRTASVGMGSAHDMMVNVPVLW